jgi:hypothetical protein
MDNYKKLHTPQIYHHQAQNHQGDYKFIFAQVYFLKVSPLYLIIHSPYTLVAGIRAQIHLACPSDIPQKDLKETDFLCM